MVASCVALPPSERDFEVYRLVVVEGASTREAAAALGLSQTRVMQLRDRVSQWIATHPAQDELTKEQRLRMAEYAAGQRLEYLYELAIGAWHESKGDETIQRREGFIGPPVVITRQSQGKVCYLTQAMRIAAQLARIPKHILPLDELWEDDEAAASEPISAANHPEGDCSPVAAPSHEAQPTVAAPDQGTAALETTCGKTNGELDEVLDHVFSTVHPLLEDESARPQMHRPLSRKQRRQQQRELARAKKRPAATP